MLKLVKRFRLIGKKVIQNHNGFIMAKGKPGVGSTFDIFIPVNE
jgi:signal transduction histidine kinase